MKVFFREWVFRLLLAIAIAQSSSLSFGDDPHRHCEQNLRAIHDAVTAYREDLGSLPPSLSALVWEGYIDQRLLICPQHSARGTNPAMNPLLIDNLGQDPLTLYIWEYAPGETADLHERQRKIGAGDWVPMVRCRDHIDSERGHNHLNLAIHGGIYPSGLYWESAVRNVIPASYLLAQAIINAEPVIPLKDRILSRSPEANDRQIDLGPSLNAAFTDRWLIGSPGEEAPELLAKGGDNRLWGLNGFSFEIRGVVQLEGTTAAEGHPFFDQAQCPYAMRPLEVDLTTDRFHLLCGVIGELPESAQAGKIIATDEQGRRTELMLRHGIHVAHAETLTAAEIATIVWSRSRPDPTYLGVRSVSHVVWTLPERQRVVGIEFEAADTASYPFLLGITAE